MLNEKNVIRIIPLMVILGWITACSTAPPSPTPLSVTPTLEPPLSETPTPAPATEEPPTQMQPTFLPILPETTPIPLNFSLGDLPVIEPGNGTRLELLIHLPGRLVFSPDMTSLAVDQEDGIYVYEATGLGAIDFLPCEQEYGCAFAYSTDGRLLAWNPQDGIVRIQEVSNGAIIQELSGISNTCCTQITFSPEGRYLAVVDEQRLGSLWDIQNGREHISLGEVQQVHFSPDGKTLAGESAVSVSLTLWDIESKRESQTLSEFSTASPTYSVQFSPDWRYLLWGTNRATVQLMDMSTGQLGKAFDLSVAAFSPDGQILAGTEQGWGPFDCSYQLCLFELPSGDLLTKIEYEALIGGLEFAPDGRLLAFMSDDLVRIWDITARSELVALDPQVEEGAWKAVFSPNGRVLAVHISGGGTQLWGVAP